MTLFIAAPAAINSTIEELIAAGADVNKATSSISKIGPCWKPGCTARIYPQELKAIIDAVESTDKEGDMKIYEQYRHAFNKKYKK